MNFIKVWRCNRCKDVVVSDSRRHHYLDMCKCKSCFMDLEQYCVRHGFKDEKDLEIIYEYEW
jgi:hypothetical protein